MNRLDLTWRNPGLADPLAQQRRDRQGPQGSLNSLVWMALLAAVCVVALLLAFRQVVLQGMQQSEARHRAVVAHADAVWRCNALRGVTQRRACRAQIDAADATALLAADRSGAVSVGIAEVDR